MLVDVETPLLTMQGVKGRTVWKKLAFPDLKEAWTESFMFFRADSSRGDEMIINT